MNNWDDFIKKYPNSGFIAGEHPSKKTENHEFWDDVIMDALVNARMMEAFWFDQWQYKCGLFECVECHQKSNWLRQIHEERAFVCMSCYEKWLDKKNAELLAFVKGNFDEEDEDVKKLLALINRK
jgi:hypothetical protein